MPLPNMNTFYFLHIQKALKRLEKRNPTKRSACAAVQGTYKETMWSSSKIV